MRCGVLYLAMAMIVVTITPGMSGCGGGGSSDGGGPASTMTISTVTTNAAGQVVYQEGAINDLGYYDPSFSGAADPIQGTLITMCSGVTGTAGTCTNALINIRTSGMAPGGYTINGSSYPSTNYIFYDDGSDNYQSIASQGTITLTSVGNVGQPIAGSFDAILSLWTSATTTMRISGTFSVNRDH